ncbi:MAG: hypothetical protein ACHP7N_06890 [Caulobacterales bacterium]
MNFPAALAARSPWNEADHCAFRVGRDDQFKRAEHRRRQPAFNFWSMLAGRVPPVPDLVGRSDDLTSLVDAHACFLGLQRPLAEDRSGENVVAYVLKPKVFYAYDVAAPGLAVRRPVPHDLLFMAYVRLDEPFGLKATSGMLTHWQFLEAGAVAMLPTDFDDRYTRRLW